MTNNSKTLESLLPTPPDEDGVNRFLRGKEANLGSLRSYHTELTKNYFDNRSNGNNGISQNEDEDQEKDETIVCYFKSVSVTIQNAPAAYEGIIGQLIVSTKRVFFIACSEKDTEKDFMVDAHCISLHAMMSESVYCQLADDNVDDEDYVGPSEIFFYPQISSSNEAQEKITDIDERKRNMSQLLFDSFTELINLNPVFDDDENDGGAAGGLMAMLGMLSGNSQYDDDDDMICRVDPSCIGTREENQDDNDPSNNERTQMLERLDNLLVVPPEYEIDGQFDDADEEKETSAVDGINGDKEDGDINNIL
jgi:hypothetical protein